MASRLPLRFSHSLADFEKNRSGSDLGHEINALQLIESVNLSVKIGTLAISAIDEEK